MLFSSADFCCHFKSSGFSLSFHRSVAYRHLKLMLVGLAGQGKTSLLKLLRREATSSGKLLSTVGVDLAEWKCQPYRRSLLYGSAPPPVHFSTWDFAGQREYYATHQCFLTKRSVYLAVWCVTSGLEGLMSLDDWLRNIQARAPGATVIIVGTHIDQVEGGFKHCNTFWLPIVRKRYRMDSPVVQQEELGFPHVVALKFVCSAGAGQHIDDLYNTIYDTACAIPAFGAGRSSCKLIDQEIPASYLVLQEKISAFRSQLLQKAPPLLYRQDFRKKFGSIVDNAEDLDVAVRFLHDNGVLLHFKSKMQNVYFLDPQWLCNLLSRVITVREIMPFTKEGMLPLQCLNHVFNNDAFPAHLVSLCVQLLSKFEVALMIDNENLLIPSQLPTVPAPIAFHKSTHAWSASCCMYQRLYLMVYIPNSFWPLLITRLMSSELKVDLCTYASRSVNLCAETVRWRLWRHGIQLLLEDVPVLTLEEVAACDVLKGKDAVPVKASWIDGKEWKLLTLLDPAKCLHVTVLDFKESELSSSAQPDCSTDKEPLAGGSVNVSIQQARRSLQLRLLTECTEAVDTILTDWYPGLGDRESHMSTGTAYVTRCHICPKCSSVLAAPGVLAESIDSAGRSTADLEPGSERCYPAPANPPQDGSVCLLLLDQLVALACRDMTAVHCYRHGPVSIGALAPDVMFKDLSDEALVPSEAVDQGNMIGAGSFGDVFRGVITSPSNKDVAIKVFQRNQNVVAQQDSANVAIPTEHYEEFSLSLSGISSIAKSFSSLRQEAAVLWRLHHSNVVALAGVRLNVPALLLEWAPRGALDSYLSTYSLSLNKLHQSFAARYGLPPIVLLRVLQQVSAGLSYLHKLSIIYRDLKAANVLLWEIPSPDDLAASWLSRVDFYSSRHVHVKLSDYGISRVSGIGGVRGMAGTPGFMAPEIVNFGGLEVYTKQVDVFSFGMFIYELMTLEYPYGGVVPSHIEVLLRQGIMPYPTGRVLNFPVLLQLLLRRCSALDPRARPSTSQIASELHGDEMLCMVDAVPILGVFSNIISYAFHASDQISCQLWLSSVGESQAVLGVTYGGEKHGTTLQEVSGDSVSKLCCTGAYLWVCKNQGQIEVFDRESMTAVHQWHLPGSVKYFEVTKPLLGGYVQCVRYVADLERVFVALSNGLVFSYPADLELLVKCTGSAEQSSGMGTVVSAVLRSTFVLEPVSFEAGIVQLWCGHAGGEISVLSSDDMSVLTTLKHPESDIPSQPAQVVLYTAVSQPHRTTDVCVWTASHPSLCVHCWVADSEIPVETINCGEGIADGSAIINCLSSAASLLAVALSNGYVVLVNVDQRCILRSLHFYHGPIHIGLLVTFSEGEISATPRSAKQLSVSKTCHWLPAYLCSFDTSMAPSGNLPMIAMVTVGECLRVPDCCQSRSLQSSVDCQLSGQIVCLWDVQQLISNTL